MNEHEDVPSEARRQAVELAIQEKKGKVSVLAHEIKLLSRGTTGLTGDLKDKVDAEISRRAIEKAALDEELKPLTAELEDLNLKLKIHN